MNIDGVYEMDLKTDEGLAPELVEVGKRVADAVEMILGAEPMDAMVESLGEDALSIINMAYDYLAQRHESYQMDTAWHIEARRELYRRCLALQQFEVCRKLLADIAKMQGIDKPAKGEKRSEKIDGRRKVEPDPSDPWKGLKVI